VRLETLPHKRHLFVEIDFFRRDAPALRNEFKVWLTSGLLEGSSVADAPDWFRAGADTPRYLRAAYKLVTSDDLLVVCRAGDGVVSIHALNFLVNESFRFLSDEAVESIGKEDCVRTVACLGKDKTDEYFREKRMALA
jgi:hypothetical protein